MKMDFPQVDLPTEVLAWTNVTEDILNIYKQSCRLQACIGSHMYGGVDEGID